MWLIISSNKNRNSHIIAKREELTLGKCVVFLLGWGGGAKWVVFLWGCGAGASTVDTTISAWNYQSVSHKV